MTPLRNLLGRKTAPNGTDSRRDDDKDRAASDYRASPLSIKKSNENGNNEFKLSGMPLSLSGGSIWQ